MPDFTPTEKRLLDILCDGEAHTKTELEAAIWDEYHIPDPRSATFASGALRVALHRLRKKLERCGMLLPCLPNNTYRLTRLLASPYTGYK